MHDKYAADMKADGVDRFPDHWVRERTHEEIAAKLNELAYQSLIAPVAHRRCFRPSLHLRGPRTLTTGGHCG